MNLFKCFATAALIASSSMIYAQNSASFSYAFSNDTQTTWGYGTVDDYDVAIFINSPEMVGKKIVSVSVPIVSAATSDESIWLSTGLFLESKKNKPDICSKTAARNGNNITVTFDEPYTITDKGVYVGYSFKCPVSGYDPVCAVEKSVPGSFFIHTSRHQIKWIDFSEDKNLCSRIKVNLEGDFSQSSVGIVSLADVMQETDKDYVAAATLINLGSSPIKTLEYTVSSENGTFSNTLNVSNSGVAPNYLEKFNVNMPLGDFSRIGDNPYTLTITKVNGVENNNDLKSGTGHVHIISYSPVNRPLMEEYTSFTCKWCTRGFAAMERMYKLYPEDFIAVSYHRDDALTITRDFPNKVDGIPTSFLNRYHECDPYFGNGTGGFLIEPLWNDFRKQSVPVGVELNVTWNNEEKTQVRVESSAIFVRSADQQYNMSYILVSNNLHNAKWGQGNEYAGASNQNQFIEEMKQFFDSPSVIVDFVYDDVAAATSEYIIENSLPRNPEINTENKYVYVFDLDKAVSVTGVNMIAEPSTLRVVAMVVDEEGRVINSNMAKIKDVVSVDNLMADTYTVSTEYYTLDGVRVANPQKGLYIKVDTLANGQRTSSRVIL